MVTMAGNKYITGPEPKPYSLHAIYTYSAYDGSQLYLNDNELDDAAQPADLFASQLSYDPRVADPPVTFDGMYIQANAGARPADRDSVDARIIYEVSNRTGHMISSQNEVGGYPALAVITRPLTLPANPHQVQPSGYTRLEEWLHGMAAQVEGFGTDGGDVTDAGTVSDAGAVAVGGVAPRHAAPAVAPRAAVDAGSDPQDAEPVIGVTCSAASGLDSMMALWTVALFLSVPRVLSARRR
jgi:hypothetical protein